MVTHDIEMASRTDRAVIIRDGKIQNSLSNPTETLILHEMGGEIYYVVTSMASL